MQAGGAVRALLLDGGVLFSGSSDGALPSYHPYSGGDGGVLFSGSSDGEGWG